MKYVTAAASFLLSLPIWAAMVVLDATLGLLGLFIVAGLAYTQSWRARESKAYPDKRIVKAWTPAWAWLWGNEEDGVTGALWFRQREIGKSAAHIAFLWSALRNSTNNLRFVPVLSLIVNPTKVRFVAWSNGENWYAWQGLYSNLRLQIGKYRFWLGWKIKPTDSDLDQRLPADDYRYPGCGFGLQLKKVG